ncbi:Uncharacterized protein dnl_37830 [Desulfonema limicola]|uniref:Uncharacterized protein n=1 Tax=Desulfonema limicola TaxID=45656 RepID=A0A975GI34_9BACT|nr:Uncharacterized protein dnl_37830 [Desulfonema limicola]
MILQIFFVKIKILKNKFFFIACNVIFQVLYICSLLQFC